MLSPRKTVLSLAPWLCILANCLAQPQVPLCSTVRPVESYCGNPLLPPNKLCGDLPHDVNFKQNLAGYSTLQAVCQKPFDDFAWQSFVALNWPLDDTSKPRPWEEYRDPASIFDKTAFAAIASAVPGASATGPVKILYRMAKESPLPGEHPTPFFEATGQPLIDRNLNFTLYEVRINPVWVNYVVNTAKLATKAEQLAFITASHIVKFPPGHYADDIKGSGGSLGAMEVKAAWRILDPSKGDKPERYYTRKATIYVDGANTVSGKRMVIKNVLVGLVALHINVDTVDGKGSVWPTFEQEDNAPPENGAAGSTVYSYYNPACTGCKPNVPPALINGEKTYKWSATAPYAQRYAVNGKYGTQVVITQPIFGETEDANRRWHEKLGKSVWSHYRLVATQWENHESRSAAGIPPVAGNAVLETYIQPTSSCISCHSSATLAAHLPNKPAPSAGFSFLLHNAH